MNVWSSYDYHLCIGRYLRGTNSYTVRNAAVPLMSARAFSTSDAWSVSLPRPSSAAIDATRA